MIANGKASLRVIIASRFDHVEKDCKSKQNQAQVQAQGSKEVEHLISVHYVGQESTNE